MKHIHKYLLPNHPGNFALTMSLDAEFLSVGVDLTGRPAIWVLESNARPDELKEHRFALRWTGDEFTGPSVFRGTFNHSGLMYHLFQYTR